VPHPHIVSESGRAVVAHHSVLVVEAFGAIEKTPTSTSSAVDDHKLVKSLVDTLQNLSTQNLGESWHDCISGEGAGPEDRSSSASSTCREGAPSRSSSGRWPSASTGVDVPRARDRGPRRVDDLKNQLADQHICNFSVFQSLLDHWALGALFPIVPIHRLDERPVQSGALVDITCDSDGKVSKFIDLNDVRDTLALHAITTGSPTTSASSSPAPTKTSWATSTTSSGA
jgi:arginine decarboxylase